MKLLFLAMSQSIFMNISPICRASMERITVDIMVAFEKVCECKNDLVIIVGNEEGSIIIEKKRQTWVAHAK